MAVADGTGLSVVICAESATPHEVTLVQQILIEILVALGGAGIIKASGGAY
jgi:hypothetical protein